MTIQRAEQTVRFIENIDRRVGSDRIKIAFHGGEPLAAGHDFFRFFLGRLAETFSGRKMDIGLQSNLGLLDDGFCDLFEKHEVSIGTSLDGPENVNDGQRGRAPGADRLERFHDPPDRSEQPDERRGVAGRGQKRHHLGHAGHLRVDRPAQGALHVVGGRETGAEGEGGVHLRRCVGGVQGFAGLAGLLQFHVGDAENPRQRASVEGLGLGKRA